MEYRTQRNPRWKYESLLAKLLGVDAIVLYPFIFTRHSVERTSQRLIRHELKHIEQVRRLGLPVFYLSYLFHYARGLVRYRNHVEAYLAIPFEIEARAAENDSLVD